LECGDQVLSVQVLKVIYLSYKIYLVNFKGLSFKTGILLLWSH
jgi:hypothetical protein